MKNNIFIVTSVVFSLLIAKQGFSQGFLNLDFESAQIIPLTSGADYPPYSISTSDALPSWAVYYGTNLQSQITYNDPSTGSSFVTLWATNGQQISGDYSVLLQGGLTASAATISQTGVVPISAQSMLFEAQAGAGTLQVSMGDQSLLFSALSTGPNYTLYGAAIPAGMAGQSEQLEFSALEDVAYPNNWNIDNISFSSTPTPEPRIWALTALGGLLLVRRRRKAPAA